jgi:EAL domain-containing protein (putative c-di-GMP-specific phosphodiesterase class I)
VTKADFMTAALVHLTGPGMRSRCRGFGARLHLGKNLGLDVVAEGVETQAAWDALREQGCKLAQDYFIGRPMPADELAALLEERAPRTGPEPLAVAENG